MAHRLDMLISARGWTNAETAKRVRCSEHYLSGIRNGERPGLKLALRLCRLFPGLTLRDLGIEIDPEITGPTLIDADDGEDAA